MGSKVLAAFVALIAFSVVLPSVFAWHGYDSWQPYSSVYSSVRESEWMHVTERESARSGSTYPYNYYGNGFSEFSRSRDFEFSRSYDAEYRSTGPSYNGGYYSGMPSRNRMYRDSYSDYYGPGQYGWGSYHYGALPFGYGYYNP